MSLREPGAGRRTAGPRRPRAGGRRGRPTRGRTACGSRPEGFGARGSGFGNNTRFSSPERRGPSPFYCPGHHGPKLRTYLLNRAVLRGAAQLVEAGSARAAFADPFFREYAAANVREQLPHLFPHRRTDDARATSQIAVFRSVADRMPHEAEAAAIDQVDDQLQLV